MKRTTLNYEELNKRVNEVFMMNDEDKVYGVFEDECGQIRVCIENEIEQTVWDYLPNMTERFEARDYIMGRRDNFND